MTVAIILTLIIVITSWLFYRHQCLLRHRAQLMREALRCHDYSFALPLRGLFFGERAMQKALNDTVKDISNLTMRNEVEAWQRLTRVLTHEVMNATAPIQSICQTYLDSTALKGSPYEEGIQTIHDTSTALTNFVNSYRKITQLQKPQLEAITLSSFIDSIRKTFPNVQWQTNISPQFTVNADRNLLRQVFINILKNAIEAGAKTISICHDDKNDILISNDGAPIPPDVRRDIFVPFFTTKPNGNGIGLSLSRQILLLQNMSLSLADTPQSGFHVTYVISSTL